MLRAVLNQTSIETEISWFEVVFLKKQFTNANHEEGQSGEKYRGSQIVWLHTLRVLKVHFISCNPGN